MLQSFFFSYTEAFKRNEKTMRAEFNRISPIFRFALAIGFHWLVFVLPPVIE